MEPTTGNTALKITVTILLTMAFVFFGFAILILLAITGFQAVSLAWSALYVYLFIFLLLLTWNRNFLKKWKKIFLSILGVLIIAIPVINAYDNYVDNIPTVGDFDRNQYGALYAYEPFRNDSLAAKLAEASTLKLTENLPKIDCATALYPVAAAFVQETYPQQKYETKNDLLSCSGTAVAYARLIKGDTDIIFAAEPSDEQIEAAKAAGVELTLTPIGKEAFVFFVNSKNCVDNLTIEQIQGIYSGEIKNWKKIGGKNQGIRAFQREENSGSQTALVRLMGGKPLTAAPREDVVGSMGGIINQVADYKNYENAIGYSFRYFSTEMVKNNQIKLLKLNGVYPDKDTIRSGGYPIVGDFYAVTAGTANPNVQELIDWILSPQGQHLIEETGYVAIN